MPRLWELCGDGKLAEVRSALARGENVNEKNSIGDTALMHAVCFKHNFIVKLLLDQPAVDVNVKDKWGQTALHRAAYVNNAEGARMLLLHKDFNSANVTNNDGNTALMIAVIYKKEEVLRELVNHQCVSLDVGGPETDQRFGDLLSIVKKARERRAKVSRSRVSREQSERFKLLVEQNEEKEKTLREENLRKLEDMKLENEDEEKKLKEKNQRKLSMLMEENKVQEALMLAKHEEEEKAVWKEECERHVPSAVQVPECPVCLEEMVPPTRIFQCRNGHLICETCKSGLSPCICPKCRGEIIGRATDMEAFLRSLQ